MSSLYSPSSLRPHIPPLPFQDFQHGPDEQEALHCACFYCLVSTLLCVTQARAQTLQIVIDGKQIVQMDDLHNVSPARCMFLVCSSCFSLGVGTHSRSRGARAPGHAQEQEKQQQGICFPCWMSYLRCQGRDYYDSSGE